MLEGRGHDRPERRPSCGDLRGASVAYVAQDPTSALNPALEGRYPAARDLRRPPRTDRTAPRSTTGSASCSPRSGSTQVARALDSYPHQLSGGQQQRVMLAMAFACRPKLIVLDEPTTGLDVTTQRHVLDSIRGLCRIYRVGAVYVSHDLAVVADIADTIGVMYAGRLVELGPAARVFRAPGASVHAGAAAGDPIAHPRARARGDGGAAATPGRAAERMLLRRPLRVHGRRLPDRVPGQTSSSTASGTGRGACAPKR